MVTLFLLYAGGFTTTIGAGMIFPDWPLSNGSLNPEGWTQNTAMAAEHSHRLLGMIVGNLTLALTFWIWWVDGRRWMRRMGIAALILVVLQGILGGVRVLENEVNYAIVHGCLGQIFFCVLTAIAIGHTRVWHKLREKSDSPVKLSRTTGVVLIALLFVQLIVAAIMRHKGAGLAIPTFPLTPEGGLLPANWNFGVAIHFAHRALAVVILFAYSFWIVKLMRSTRQNFIRGLGLFACILLFVQITLGAAVIWMGRAPIITTMHVLNSAFLLATTWATHFFCYHAALEKSENVATAPANQADGSTNPQAVGL
ncbi:cytochrome oxidase assembly protein [Coraliomargarita sinensis]|uniref:Cytochrome oxidase assembly protein n=1 Tax=Coraliomargarita sinensis TaxID=2174842 RepID=A0A317ZD97_9BACT|nr:cytochrome oxidase assembly protein [Coraliomargarita sinensis]